MSSSIPSWQIITAHAQPFRGARDLAFCVKFPLDSLLVWASSEGSGETAQMRRLAWTFAARIGYKYQIRLTRSIWSKKMIKITRFFSQNIWLNLSHTRKILIHCTRNTQQIVWMKAIYNLCFLKSMLCEFSKCLNVPTQKYAQRNLKTKLLSWQPHNPCKKASWKFPVSFNTYITSLVCKKKKKNKKIKKNIYISLLKYVFEIKRCQCIVFLFHMTAILSLFFNEILILSSQISFSFSV